VTNNKDKKRFLTP